MHSLSYSNAFTVIRVMAFVILFCWCFITVYLYISDFLIGHNEMTSMHTVDMDPNKDYDMELHHMHFTHGDTVQISISVTNGAGSSTEAESNGFLVDLTDPVMYTLRDGYNSDKDLEYTVRFTPDLQRGGEALKCSICFISLLLTRQLWSTHKFNFKVYF